jgi:hypothetical protein
MAYDAVKAIPLNAREAMRGSPSPRKVFAMMPNDANARDKRLRLSVKERAAGVDALIDEFRTTIAVAASLQVGDTE